MKPKEGDIVICIKDNEHYRDLFGKEFVVSNPEGNKEYEGYVGEHILAEDMFGATVVLKEGSYKIKDKPEQNVIKKEEIELGDKVRPLKTDKTTQQPFYYVTNVEINGIAFLDDLGQKRWLSFNAVEKVSDKDILDVVARLSVQHNRDRNILKKTMEEMIKILEKGVDELYN